MFVTSRAFQGAGASSKDLDRLGRLGSSEKSAAEAEGDAGGEGEAEGESLEARREEVVRSLSEAPTVVADPRPVKVPVEPLSRPCPAPI